MYERKNFITVKELHAFLGGQKTISIESVYNEIKKGEIPSVKVGMRKLIPMWYVEKISKPEEVKNGKVV